MLALTSVQTTAIWAKYRGVRVVLRATAFASAKIRHVDISKYVCRYDLLVSDGDGNVVL